jgi:segregation and condensation protein B
MSKKNKKKNVKELTLDAVSALEGLLENPSIKEEIIELELQTDEADEIELKPSIKKSKNKNKKSKKTEGAEDSENNEAAELASDHLSEEPLAELSASDEELIDTDHQLIQGDDEFVSEISEAEIEASSDLDFEQTELAGFETAQIDIVEDLDENRVKSIVESALFASHRPVSIAFLKETLKGTNIKTDQIRAAIKNLKEKYLAEDSGIMLEEVSGGYQIRTQPINSPYLSKTLKVRPFKLSGPALEVLSIVAYKQPLVKAEIDQIRGVESGHLLRALMEKSIVGFVGKSELPGKPMLYGTTRKFLEIFNLRNLAELPSLSEIDELLPEGITEEDDLQKTKLADITDGLAHQVGEKYSENEEELNDIVDQLKDITTHFEVPKAPEEDPGAGEPAPVL